MAHFAKLDENNIVLEVLVVNNETIDNLPFPESEPVGIVFLTELTGHTNWKQTSYNGSFRKHYAGQDYTYMSDIDAFVQPKPFPSWLLNTQTATWYPPVPYPQDDKIYTWDETTTSWKEVA
jgi:hypothetical protein